MYCNLYTTSSVAGSASLQQGSAGGTAYTVQKSSGYSNVLPDAGRIAAVKPVSSRKNVVVKTSAKKKTTAKLKKGKRSLRDV